MHGLNCRSMAGTGVGPESSTHNGGWHWACHCLPGKIEPFELGRHCLRAFRTFPRFSPAIYREAGSRAVVFGRAKKIARCQRQSVLCGVVAGTDDQATGLAVHPRAQHRRKYLITDTLRAYPVDIPWANVPGQWRFV